MALLITETTELFLFFATSRLQNTTGFKGTKVHISCIYLSISIYNKNKSKDHFRCSKNCIMVQIRFKSLYLNFWRKKPSLCVYRRRHCSSSSCFLPEYEIISEVCGAQKVKTTFKGQCRKILKSFMITRGLGVRVMGRGRIRKGNKGQKKSGKADLVFQRV